MGVDGTKKRMAATNARWEDMYPEAAEVIRAHFGHNLRSIVGPNGETWKARKSKVGVGNFLRPEDREDIIIGLALRLTSKEIKQIVNKKRTEANLGEIDYVNIFYYRKMYADLIDEVYVTIALRIGEIYRYSDKVYRISRYNDLANYLHDYLSEKMVSGEGITDKFLKVSNLYKGILDRLNVEMGGKPLLLSKPKEKPPDEKEVGKDELDVLIKDELSKRYDNQLPARIEQKVFHTDYLNCANGEQIGADGITVCWNDQMTDNDAGSQCPVQTGKFKQCPKFLNRQLLDNKKWLMDSREMGISIKKISKLLGCDEYDLDIRSRIVMYLRKFDLIKVGIKRDEKKDVEVETLEDIVEADYDDIPEPEIVETEEEKLEELNESERTLGDARKTGKSPEPKGKEDSGDDSTSLGQDGEGGLPSVHSGKVESNLRRIARSTIQSP